MSAVTEAARAALEALRYYANESFDGYAQPNGATAQDCITKVSAALAASEVQAEPVALPPAYMLAKLQMVMPIFQEARDALCALTEAQRRLRGISPTLADRMDEAGTFSLDDWQQAHPPAPEQPAPALASAPRVPQGWKLVPVEPTLEMVEVGRRKYETKEGTRRWWAEMLAAAPQPEEDTP